MIPRVIHQTAKTAEIPDAWRAYQRKLIALHPQWAYRLWTDADNLEFVREEFPDLLEIFVRLPKGIMRADVIRYLLMYRIGGLYVDLDYEMLKPFDLDTYDCVLPQESDDGVSIEKLVLANASFAAVPGHPFFKAIIDDLRSNPPLRGDGDVLSQTGPAYISRIFMEQFADRREELGIYLAPRPLFAPKTPRNRRQYEAIVKQGTAYGVHHCHGTWRTYSLLQRIRRLILNGVHRLAW